MKSRVVRVGLLLAVAGAAVGVAGIGLFSVLKFFNLSDEVIYGFAFLFFFGIFFVAGQYAYPAIFKRRGSQGISFQHRAAASEVRPAHAASVSSASRAGTYRSKVAASSAVVVGPESLAAGAAVSHTTINSRSRRATGHLRVVPLQSNLNHTQVAQKKDERKNTLIDAREQLISGRIRVARILERDRRRLEALESKMVLQVHRITASGINNLVMAKRMIAALERRLSEVDAAIAADPEQSNIEKTSVLLAQDLTLPEDAVSSVVGAKKIPPIRFSQIETTLNDLIGKIASRRELAGAAA